MYKEEGRPYEWQELQDERTRFNKTKTEEKTLRQERIDERSGKTINIQKNRKEPHKELKKIQFQ